MISLGRYHTKEVRKDLMIDLETLGTNDNAVILSIGAIAFDPFGETESLIDENGEYVCPSFYRVLHKETQVGRVVEEGTVAWWSSPDKAEAYAQIIGHKDKVHLPQAMDELWDWIVKNCAGNKAWACAPNFDIDMLSHAYRNTGVATLKGAGAGRFFPMQFWDFMDVRTIETFVFGGKYKKTVRKGTHHNALDDCVTQALTIQEAWRRIKPTYTPEK